MNASNHREYRIVDDPRISAPEIPKQKLSWFTWLFVGFAFLVLFGILVMFVNMADEPRPVLDVPHGEPAPAAPRPLNEPPAP